MSNQIPSIRGIQGAKECLAIKEQHWECLIILYHFDCFVVFDDGIVLQFGDTWYVLQLFFHTSCKVWWCVGVSTSMSEIGRIMENLPQGFKRGAGPFDWLLRSLGVPEYKNLGKTKQKGLHPKRLQAHTNRSSDNPLFFSCYAGAICFSSPEFTWETMPTARLTHSRGERCYDAVVAVRLLALSRFLLCEKLQEVVERRPGMKMTNFLGWESPFFQKISWRYHEHSWITPTVPPPKFWV